MIHSLKNCYKQFCQSLALTPRNFLINGPYIFGIKLRTHGPPSTRGHIQAEERQDDWNLSQKAPKTVRLTQNGHISEVTQGICADGMNLSGEVAGHQTQVLCGQQPFPSRYPLTNQLLVLFIPKAQLNNNKNTCFLTRNSLSFLSQYFALASKSYCGSSKLSSGGFSFFFF